MWGVVGGWVGKVSKEKKKKTRWGVGKKQSSKKHIEIMGKKNWEGGGEKIKLQKKLRSGLIKVGEGQRKINQPKMA